MDTSAAAAAATVVAVAAAAVVSKSNRRSVSQSVRQAVADWLLQRRPPPQLYSSLKG